MYLKNISAIFLGLSICNLAAATSCIVVGDRTAKVQSSNGERSPVFLTGDCASLRSVSGKAMITWVSKDGKVNFSPIGFSGPERQPVAGSEERSGNVVWAELSTTRETRRPAFMRSLSDEKAVAVYIPETGVLIKPKAGENLRILSTEAGVDTLMMEGGEEKPLLITRDKFKLGSTYLLEWTKGDNVDKEKWKLLGLADSLNIDVNYKDLQEADLDQEQRKIVTAMLFEQLKLITNMRIALSDGFRY